MANYKTCVKYQMDLCPIARNLANNPEVRLDCSKCEDYACENKKCGDCKHYDARDAYCGVNHKFRFFRENSAACDDYEERQEETNTEDAKPTIKIAFDKLTTISDSEFENALEKGTVKLVYETEHDAVNHPSHYTVGGIECIEALKAATTRLTGIEAVCTANAIKYLWRWKDKNGAEDIRKAIWYCERLLKEIGDEQT